MWLCWPTIFFLYKQSWERFFSSLKNTIVLYLVKKFDTFMVIFTSGRRRVFFKKRFFISASRTIHLTLNLQARLYRNINYYNIYTCSFTQYYLSMLRNKKKLKVVYYYIQIYSEMFWKIIHLHSRFPIMRSSSIGDLSATSARGIPSISYLLLRAVMRIIWCAQSVCQWGYVNNLFT